MDFADLVALAGVIASMWAMMPILRYFSIGV
jgi:hypothetical protein